MTAVTSPAALQQMCEAAVATWLTDWSGLVGRVSARSAHRHSHQNHNKQLFRPSCSGYSKNECTLHKPNCDFQMRSETDHSRKDSKQRRKISRENSRYRDRKRARKESKTIDICYDKVPKFDEQFEKSVITERLGYVYSDQENKQQINSSNRNSQRVLSDINVIDAFDELVLKNNVDHCSSFFRRFLPPSVAKRIINFAWKQLSRLVDLGSHNECVQEYQISYWSRRAPVLLRLGSEFSLKTFPLNISGIPENLIENVLLLIDMHFPVKHLTSLVIPRANFKRAYSDFSVACKDTYKDILLRTSLTSVVLNSELCDDSILSIFSQLSLRELEIGGSSVTEKGIVNGLYGLPVETASEALDVIESEIFQCLPQFPLRQSLQKLSISIHGVPSAVYLIAPVIFSELSHYNPHRNAVEYVQHSARIMRKKFPDFAFKFLKMNLMNTSRANLIDISRTCPKLQDITLTVDLDAEETIAALENFSGLSHLDIKYYPSFPSSPPKLNGRALVAVIDKFKLQLRSLDLTGFMIPGNILYDLSLLPELTQLSLTDCWLSNLRSMPSTPFPSLSKMSLNFLPSNSAMQALTMGGGMKNLHLNLRESEWEGNALTDNIIKSLVSSGMLSSLETFTAQSSYLTLDSLQTLSSLPCLNVIGNLASWGLTEEELRCVSHTRPQHIICFL